jgi:hypothetical protein
MSEMVEASSASVMFWLIGDSSWRTFPQYNETSCEDPCTIRCHDDELIPVALVVNMSKEGSALRQNKRRSEKCIQEYLKLCDMDGASPFIPIQVPFRGGRRSSDEDDGKTREEDFVSSCVVFTKPLSSLFRGSHWIDDNHFDRPGAEKLLHHACALNSVRAQLEHSACRGGHIPIVCVLSDGWNRGIQEQDRDRSRYWNCRLEFGMCRSLSDFRNWCEYYAGWSPATTDCLPRTI